MTSCSRVERLMQTIREGGSSESEVTAVAVMPCRRDWSAAVITDTAAGKRRIASLKEARSSSAVIAMAVPSHRHLISHTIFAFANISQQETCICNFLSWEAPLNRLVWTQKLLRDR